MRTAWRLVLLGGAHLVVSLVAFKVALDGAVRILEGAPVSISFRLWQSLAAVLCFPLVDITSLLSRSEADIGWFSSFPWRFPIVLIPFILNSALWVVGVALVNRAVANRRARAV